GGNRWVKTDNLPIGQFYHVSVDGKDPYQVYGGLQDNSVWVGDSAYPGGITNSRWENLGGGDGFWAWPDPADPEGFAYVESQGGALLRVNRKTLEARDIQPRSDSPEKLRFNWNAPVVLSPNEKGTIYIGAQYLYRSRDHGQTWDKISPDLTTNNKDEQRQEQSGGITVDNSVAEMHTTIFTISESPKQAGLIWVGTDDGNLQLTRDGGKSWTNLTANIGLPPQSWVSWVEASRYDPSTAYAAFDRHTFGDMAPYVYRTTDYGRTWTPIVRPGQGVRGFAHVIKEDPQRPDLLYLGTEFGLWISPNGGRDWAQFKGHEFPDVPVRDLAFQNRDGDLAIATYGRGIWIIDDLTPLRALTPEIMAKDLAFLPSRPAQQRIEANGGWSNGDAEFVGDNPPDGAFIAYYEPHRRLIGKLTLEVLDPSGKVIDTLPASTRPGINRVVWSMRAPAPRVPPAAQIAGSSALGPRWLPGTYSARLSLSGQSLTQSFPVVLDRRVNFTLKDRQAQFAAAERVSALFGHETDLLMQINAVREGAAALAHGLQTGDPLAPRLAALSDKADVLRKEIVATKEGGAITGEERLREHTDQLYGAITSWEGQPSAYQLTRASVLEGELADIRSRFAALENTDLAGVNAALTERKLPPIVVPEPAPPAKTADAGGARSLEALGGWRLSLRPEIASQAPNTDRD
ncbi:MAG: WD40/YVTN/BNR-like repeat-containing protein, partial [Caulobacteraceae bacterium]